MASAISSISDRFKAMELSDTILEHSNGMYNNVNISNDKILMRKTNYMVNLKTKMKEMWILMMKVKGMGVWIASEMEMKW